MSEPRVSIITLTYNHAPYLAECIDSVLAQTLSDWEQIILDDGSTDTTTAIVENYRDPRLRYLRQERQGVEQIPRTYSRALALCRAPLIGFLDGDDYWPPQKLEALVPKMSDPQVVLAYGLTAVINSTVISDSPGLDFNLIPDSRLADPRFANVIRNNPKGSALRLLLDPRYLTFAFLVSALVRRSTLDRIGGLRSFPRLPVVDYPTLLYLALEGRFEYLPQVMGYWRLHGANTTLRASEAILSGAYEQAKVFMEQDRSSLPLVAEDWNAIDEAWAFFWRRTFPDQIFSLGRQHLLQAEWRAARSAFRAALRRPATPKHRLTLMLCLLLSFLHLNAEWAMRLLGRPTLRTRRTSR